MKKKKQNDRKAPDWKALRGKFLNFLMKNIVWSVVVFIGGTWFLTAVAVWLVERNAEGANIKTFEDAIWWGIVTLLTVGYGDRYPVTTFGREIGSVLMVSGVGCVGIITAKISSIFLERALRDGRGVVDSNRLNDHFIICGWNENMYELLTHMLEFNPLLKSDEIVIVAHVQPSDIEALTSDPRLHDLHFIVGDHFSEMNLRRAAPERAKKILILADRSPSPGGQPPTSTEVDARTIMTAMTLSNIARGTLVTAEILDPKMDHYLKLASVSEIIYSSEYSRLLLGNATSGTGIANIVFDLLDAKASAHITSMELEEAMFGKSYGHVKTEVEKAKPQLQVIGVLENSGNSHSIRELALRRAQQTPDVAQLVNNLQSVKQIRCNNPIFSPALDYVLKEGSMVIVIAKRQAQTTVERLNHVGSDRTQTAA